MFETVIEDQRLAFAPAASFVADAQAASTGNDQGQMANQPGVEHAVVRLNVRARLEPRIKGNRRSLRDVRQRYQIKRCHRLWCPIGMRLNPFAMPQEIKGSPGIIIAERILRHWPPRYRFDIRGKAFTLSQNRVQLLLQRRRAAFERAKPVEFVPLKKLTLREAREIKTGRLLNEQFGPTQQKVECGGDPGGGLDPRLGQAIIEMRGISGLRCLLECLCTPDQAVELRRRTVHRGDTQRKLEPATRRAIIALIGFEVAHQQQRPQIAGIARK